MRICLVRHGETEANAQRRYLGRSDPPLSEKGREELVPAGLAVGEVYVSPMLRAVQTAEILFPGTRLLPVPELREMDFGVFEGRTYQELSGMAAYQAWVDGNCLGDIPGGEGKASFCQRTNRAFAALVERGLEAGTELLAVVAHGGTQMAVLERYARPGGDYFSWQRPHGCGYMLNASRWRPEGVLEVLETVRYTR